MFPVFSVKFKSIFMLDYQIFIKSNDKNQLYKQKIFTKHLFFVELIRNFEFISD